MRKKLLSIFSIVFILTLITIQKSVGQIDLSGNWDANCVFEKTDKASISFCELCPYKMSEDKHVLSFEKFAMVFEKDTICLIINSVPTKVTYKIDNDIDIIEFTFNKKNYKFKILKIESKDIKYIMKDNDGSLILLEKKRPVLI